MDGNTATGMALLSVAVVCELVYGLSHAASPWGWAYLLLAGASLAATYLVYQHRSR